MNEAPRPSWLPPIRHRWQLARLVGRAATAREAYLTAGVPERDVDAVEEIFDLELAAWASPCRAEPGVDGGARPAWIRDVFGSDRVMVAMHSAEDFSVWLCFASTACDTEAEAEEKGRQVSELTGQPWAVVSVPELIMPTATDLGWAPR